MPIKRCVTQTKGGGTPFVNSLWRCPFDLAKSRPTGGPVPESATTPARTRKTFSKLDWVFFFHNFFPKFFFQPAVTYHGLGTWSDGFVRSRAAWRNATAPRGSLRATVVRATCSPATGRCWLVLSTCSSEFEFPGHWDIYWPLMLRWSTSEKEVELLSGFCFFYLPVIFRMLVLTKRAFTIVTIKFEI